MYKGVIKFIREHTMISDHPNHEWSHTCKLLIYPNNHLVEIEKLDTNSDPKLMNKEIYEFMDNGVEGSTILSNQTTLLYDRVTIQNLYNMGIIQPYKIKSI